MTRHLVNITEAANKHSSLLKRLFRMTHMGYFGAVILEGHGLYSTMGAAMLVFVVADGFLHFSGE